MNITNKTCKTAVIPEVQVGWYSLIYGSIIKCYLFVPYVTTYVPVQHTTHNIYTNNFFPITTSTVTQTSDPSHYLTHFILQFIDTYLGTNYLKNMGFVTLQLFKNSVLKMR